MGTIMCSGTRRALLRVCGPVSGALRIPCALLVLLLGSAVQAQTILLVDADPCPNTTWVDAYSDLQDALDDAVVFAQEGPVEIWVAEGVYKPDRGTGDRFASFDLVNNVALYGGFAGWETTRDQRDVEMYETILSGDLGRNDAPEPSGDSTCCADHDGLGCDDSACEALVCEDLPYCCVGDPGRETWDDTCAGSARYYCCDLCRPSRCENSYSVVTTTETDSSVVLDGLTITGGEGNGDWLFFVGAGFYSDLASPTVTNCTFTDNSGVKGTAMYAEGGAPNVSDSVFSNNTAYNRSHPVLYLATNEGSVLNCDFVDNQGAGLWVGSHAYPDDIVSVIGCRFIRNLLGSGLTVRTAVADVRDCLFLENTARRDGGGIRSWSYASVRNCAFIGNSASVLGGAVYQNAMGAIALVATPPIPSAECGPATGRPSETASSGATGTITGWVGRHNSMANRTPCQMSGTTQSRGGTVRGRYSTMLPLIRFLSTHSARMVSPARRMTTFASRLAPRQ
ncbi:MAG: right-handed parallel beta-helix repeat-containing protein [Planctomycetota bacterium]